MWLDKSIPASVPFKIAWFVPLCRNGESSWQNGVRSLWNSSVFVDSLPQNREYDHRWNVDTDFQKHIPINVHSSIDLPFKTIAGPPLNRFRNWDRIQSLYHDSWQCARFACTPPAAVDFQGANTLKKITSMIWRSPLNGSAWQKGAVLWDTMRYSKKSHSSSEHDDSHVQVLQIGNEGMIHNYK